MSTGFINEKKDKHYEHALVVSSSEEKTSSIKKYFGITDTTLIFSNTEEQALHHACNTPISYILVDHEMVGTIFHELISLLRNCFTTRHIPIILLVGKQENAQLSCLYSTGCDDILFEPFSLLELKVRLTSVERIQNLKNLNQFTVNEQLLAKKILTNAIDERSVKFEDISLLSISKNIFSGDIFMTSRHPDGSLNVLLADFTGHGLPAAICALPVANIFSVMTRKGFDMASILNNINTRLITLLPTDMFMACNLLSIASDLTNIKVWNGGMPDVYILSNLTGDIRHTIRSTHIPLGITEISLEKLAAESVDIILGDKIFLFSDGLVESLNANDDMFGEARVEQCFRSCNDDSIFNSVINTFNEFRGDVAPIDDVTLACIPCSANLMDEDLWIG